MSRSDGVVSSFKIVGQPQKDECNEICVNAENLIVGNVALDVPQTQNQTYRTTEGDRPYDATPAYHQIFLCPCPVKIYFTVDILINQVYNYGDAPQNNVRFLLWNSS